MQRTSESRKKTLKKPLTTSQSLPITPLNPIIATPDHPGCWRIIKNALVTPTDITAMLQNQPIINYHNSVFSTHNHTFTRLSFQNYNKRIESLMMKYGLKQETNNLEDGEIDPKDDDDDDNESKVNKNEKLPMKQDMESKCVTTLAKQIRKKFNKKSFSRIKFDNKMRITKRRRRMTYR